MATAKPTIPKKGHPPGLYLLFLTEMWERFSYYGMRALLTLYLTKTALEGGLGIEEQNATLIYGYFTGFVYLTPIIGGWLADTYLGQRRAILIGGVLMMFGQFSLAATPQLGVWSTWFGLLLIIIGNGFFKPNISTIVGDLYEQGDPRRDSAFTIFYMGINLGALIAPLLCGYFAEDLFAEKGADGTILKYAFQYGFLAAGIGMLLGQIMFNLLAQKYLGDLGKYPSASLKEKDAKGGDIPEKVMTKEEKDRIAVILTLTIFTIFFWAGFEQAGSSLTLYTDKFIDREIAMFNWTIPTSWFQSVNPLFIVLLGIPIASFWSFLSSKNKDLSIPVKMALGMVLLGIGFFFMVGASKEYAATGQKAALMWLIATYFFHTVGELCLSPIGLSMVTRLAPLRYASMLMGVWFLAPFVAQIAGGYIASYVEELGAFTIFLSIAGFSILAGVILFSISRKLVEMMHGRG